MQQAHAGTDKDLIAKLNDLMELDHDAVSAYTLAIESLEREDWKQDLVRFRGDHERHIRDLRALILAHDGEPVEHAHVMTGAFKSAVQAAGALGSDREVLLAFKSNEGQVRDTYRRASTENHPSDVIGLLTRHARDEERHYDWVSSRLDALNAGPGTPAGRAEAAFEAVHGGSATMLEGAERVVRKAPWKGGLLAAAALGAVTVGVTKLLRRS